ncbi:Signal transduction histidine kinase [Halogranum amylolyticum]|uniref:histidine kinase n=1 Tax=Halogranum amylolyticum TaxID=660520 RepID=A0A1H8URG5_9EURY|nr:cache domain-containing protein [Halogranum amylolyticum]SEP05514.1 Signal transduction histidine kinase [Halogranum amylolyticum]
MARLRTKFAVVLVVVTLVLAGSVYVALEQYKRDAVSEVNDSVDETATLAAGQIDSRVRDQRDYVGLVASRPRAAQFDQSEQFLDAFLANSRFYAAQIVAANGTVVAFRGDIEESNRRSVLGSDRSDRTYVRRALYGETYVADVRSVNGSSEHVLLISAPIFQDGEVEGALVAASFLDTQTAFDTVPPLETSSKTVRIADDERTLYASDRTFESSVRSTASVETTGWTVTVARDRSALDERLQTLALFQGVELGIVLALMVGFGYWQYAVSLRQTERLLGGFEALGRGDYDYSVSLRGGSEWEQIGDGFDGLATTLKAREAAVREHRQRLEVLHRVLRHNLRNEMSVVMNYADIAADFTTDDRVADAMEVVLGASRDLTRLSEKARQIEEAIDTGRRRRPVDLTELVETTVADLREEYPDVTLVTSLPNSSWVLASPSLRRAVENVCENACEHNDDATPRVEVSVTDPADPEEPETSDPATATEERAIGVHDGGREQVRLVVVDNGPGIPERELTALRQGRETELEHASGLGLWLTYWVVDNSGGEIEFADAEPRGAVVTIDLPGTSPAASDAPSSEREGSDDALPVDDGRSERAEEDSGESSSS